MVVRPFPQRTSALSHLVEGFVLHCRSKGLSPRTIAWYQQKLGHFRAYLETQGIPTEPTSITPTHVRLFIYRMQATKLGENNAHIPLTDKPISAFTVQGYVRTLKAFFSWLVSEEFIDESPLARISIPKAPKKIVPTLSETQVAQLLRAVNKRTPTGARDFAILCLLLDCGLRVGEVRSLRMVNVHLEDGWAMVHGKGAKERPVPLGATSQKALWRYLGVRPEPLTPAVDNVFLTRAGQPLSLRAIQDMTKRRARHAGLDGVRCNPHTFRHTFAVTYLRRGGDVFSLQRILGHSSLHVVRIYVNLAEADVLAAHRRASPLDSLAWR